MLKNNGIAHFHRYNHYRTVIGGFIQLKLTELAQFITIKICKVFTYANTLWRLQAL